RSLRRSRRDPVVDFLFDNRRGHCEYFASAMTLMCQSLGIRARLVQGYLGGEYNEAGEFYRVRQKDAHAWVEVHLSDRGWTVFDPTPSAARSPEGLDDSLSARLQRVMDYIYFSWSNWVVSFDRETRQ